MVLRKKTILIHGMFSLFNVDRYKSW